MDGFDYVIYLIVMIPLFVMFYDGTRTYWLIASAYALAFTALGLYVAFN